MHWYWIICGILMILMEFGMPGFVICFFGLSALITGGVVFVFPALTLVWQLLIFAIGGALLVIVSRWVAPGVFRGKVNRESLDIDGDDVAGGSCICREDIAPGLPGKVEFRGSLWRAESDKSIAAGENCVIEKRDNLTLTVRPSKGE